MTDVISPVVAFDRGCVGTTIRMSVCEDIEEDGVISTVIVIVEFVTVGFVAVWFVAVGFVAVWFVAVWFVAVDAAKTEAKSIRRVRGAIIAITFF